MSLFAAEMEHKKGNLQEILGIFLYLYKSIFSSNKPT